MNYLHHELRVNLVALASNRHELVNVITHGLGLALSVIGAVLMTLAVLETGDIWRILGCTAFMSAMIGVYGASTLSHAFQTRRPRQIFRAWDQALIYILIVATYTPFSLAYLRSVWGWSLLAGMWGVALFGFCSKIFFRHRVEGISVWLYLALGWIPVVTLPSLLKLAPGEGLAWMVYGGVSYTAGVIFLLADRKDFYFHAIWHVLVLFGSYCHFMGIYLHVAPVN